MHLTARTHPSTKTHTHTERCDKEIMVTGCI